MPCRQRSHLLRAAYRRGVRVRVTPVGVDHPASLAVVLPEESVTGASLARVLSLAIVHHLHVAATLASPASGMG